MNKSNIKVDEISASDVQKIKEAMDRIEPLDALTKALGKEQTAEELKDEDGAVLSPSAKPFFPAGKSSSGTEAAKADDGVPAEAQSPSHAVDPEDGGASGTTDQLDFQILAMKAQHQYIQNLQRANMALKSKIKQLEDIVANDTESQQLTEKFSEMAPPTPAQVATQADLEEPDAEQIQELELVHVGSIEEVAKQEFREARHHNSLHRGASYYDRQGRSQGEYGYYDRRGYWNKSRRTPGRNPNWSNERVQHQQRGDEHGQESSHAQTDPRTSHQYRPDGYRDSATSYRRREYGPAQGSHRTVYWVEGYGGQGQDRRQDRRGGDQSYSDYRQGSRNQQAQRDTRRANQDWQGDQENHDQSNVSSKQGGRGSGRQNATKERGDQEAAHATGPGRGRGNRGQKQHADKPKHQEPNVTGSHRTVTRVAQADVFSPASPVKTGRTDRKNKETFDQPDQQQKNGLPPRSYFDSVAQRSQALESQRKKKGGKTSEDRAPTGKDFLASTKEPLYQNRHCFFEEEFGEDGEGDFEAQDGGPKVTTKPAESPSYEPSNCEVEEVREAAPTAEDGTPNKQFTDANFEEQQMQRLLDDFGFVKAFGKKGDGSHAGLGEAAYSNSLTTDHSGLRQEIRKAVQDQDEVVLNEAVDRARDLQQEYPWGDELNKAEDLLYELLQCPAEPLPKDDKEDHGF